MTAMWHSVSISSSAMSMHHATSIKWLLQWHTLIMTSSGLARVIILVTLLRSKGQSRIWQLKWSHDAREKATHMGAVNLAAFVSHSLGFVPTEYLRARHSGEATGAGVSTQPECTWDMPRRIPSPLTARTHSTHTIPQSHGVSDY